jgi:hypothetical protein
MEPNDPQLRDLLHEWQAPQVPAGLEQRVLSSSLMITPRRGWRFLLSGYIRVPVPLACAAAVLMMFTGFWLARQTTPAGPCITATAQVCTSPGHCRS